MWTDGWVMSNCSQDSQKFVPNCFLYLIMSKNSIFSPSAKIKFAHSPKLHPQSDHIINTHKSSKNFTYAFVLRLLQFQFTSQNTHLTFKTVILAVLALKTVSESLTHSLQNYVCFFPLTSRRGSYAYKPTSCHCP